MKELLKEARTDLAQKMNELEKKMEALTEEKTQAVEKGKQFKQRLRKN